MATGAREAVDHGVPRVAGRGRAALYALSFALFGVSVSRTVLAVIKPADAARCVNPHALDYLAITLSGMLAGLATGDGPARIADAASAALSPDRSSVRIARLRRVAAAGLALSLWTPFLWLLPGSGTVIDGHRRLLAAIETALYGMGFLQQAAWQITLNRRSWLGLLISPMLALMMIANGLTARGWCQ